MKSCKKIKEVNTLHKLEEILIGSKNWGNKMLNSERSKDEIFKSFIENNVCEYKKENILCLSRQISCKEEYGCERCKVICAKWMSEPYIEPAVKNAEEDRILQELVKHMKFIVRNTEGNLVGYWTRPNRIMGYWLPDSNSIELLRYNHLFTFIRKSDEVAFDIMNNIDGTL